MKVWKRVYLIYFFDIKQRLIIRSLERKTGMGCPPTLCLACFMFVLDE
jgi:hypothetical protein